LARAEYRNAELGNSEVTAEMKKLMGKHIREIKNLSDEMAEAIAAKDEALKELEAERTKMQEEMEKWEEQKAALADDLASVIEGAKKVEEEVDRKMRAEFDGRLKETEERAKEERRLKVVMNKMSSERATADKELEALENDQRAAASRSQAEQVRIQLRLPHNAYP